MLNNGAEPVPWWGALSAAVGPGLLIGGLVLGAARQPPGYSSWRDTISALAAEGATDRWVMTSALVGLGACYVVSGIGLRPARWSGRVALVGGGLATVLVAAFPQPSSGNSVAHTIAATVAFTLLGAWPALASMRRSRVRLLRPPASFGATAVSFGLLVWFVVENHGSHRGLAERCAALTEALWPLGVVLSARFSACDASKPEEIMRKQ